MIRLLTIAGARPNFVKVAPLIREMDRAGGFDHKLIHTGQHYDVSMSQVFFDDLGIPPPYTNLEVGAGDRMEQIQRIMERFEPVLKRESPDAVVVVGDVNSTVACARVARRNKVKVVHVEAGLRSFDASMPEELNRVETDQLSDLLFVTEPSGMANLAAERVPGRAHLVGNVMIDTLTDRLDAARALQVARRLGLVPGEYVLSTFHRPSNVDTAASLREIAALVEHVASRLPVVLPLHPRTRASLDRHGLISRLKDNPRLKMIEPLGYMEFLSLVIDARAVLTDSGGIQEETTFLRIPCVTMRQSTERPITVEIGSNVLAGTERLQVERAIDAALTGPRRRGSVPSLWDGHTSARIINTLKVELDRGC